jgi:hypothetical protein
MNASRNWSRHICRRFGQQSLVLLLLLGLATAVTSAQGEASISGVVTDATGSAVPGATVKVQNLETGAVRNLVTDSVGRYDATVLPVGSYKVTVEKTGFQAQSKTEIALAVAQRVEVDLGLSVTQLQQSVTVTERADIVTVTTEDVTGLVGEREVKDLPLNGRSYDQLLTLNPGVINYTSQRAGGLGTNNSVVGNMFSTSGRRPQENLYILNGVEYTGASEINNTPGGASGQLLGVDAVREFSVVKDNYGAEYGKRPGAQVNIVTSSGTNQLHGNIYEFLRNSTFDARNYFDQSSIPQFQRNEFGGSLGGPARKDKTFLFGNYEGFRQNLGLSDVTFVPDANARKGLLPCSGLATVPANCTVTTPLTNVGVAPSVSPLFALWPQPGPELLTTNGLQSGIAEAFSSPQQKVREDFGTARLDHNFSDKDSFAGVYTIDDSKANTPSANPLSVVDLTLRNQVASLSETHIFSPSVVNKATFGFSRAAFYFTGESLVKLPGFVQGKPVGAVVVGGSNAANAATQITAAGTNASSNLTAVRNLFTAEDQVVINHGIHRFNFGVWFERLQANDTLAQNQYGQATFSNLKSFLQGTVTTFTTIPSPTPLNWRSLEGAAYAEDTLRITPTLELRIGFRGESTNGWNEANARGSNYLFDFNGVVASHPTIGSSVFTVNNAKFLPAPRVGIAWSPFTSKRTVVRAGFGTSYSLYDNLSYRLDQNPPFNTALIIRNAALSTIHIIPGAPPPSNSKVPPSGVQSDVKTPTVETYSLKIEQQISSNLSLSVAYVGSRGYHELLTIDANVPVPKICPASPCPDGYPAGIFYNPPRAPLANPNVAGTTTWFSKGISSYNGLEVDVAYRLSHGLQFRGVYTFSKALDNGDTLNTTLATNSPAYVANPLRPMDDYGRASFDVRHAAVINGSYDLPFGRVATMNAWVNRVVGNWQISGIQTLLSGIPFTPQLGYNPANDGDTRNPIRPSWNPAFAGRLIVGTPKEYFNPNAFTQPLPGTYGNVGRNILVGPRLVETDLSLAKRISLTERFNLQFRAEFFNLFNYTNLNTPNPVVFTAATGAPSPTAGVISSTATSSRQIQFGLKLLW